MEYELKNPSDPYTFLAADFEVATLTVFSISTLYGAEAKEGGESVPIFLFGGAREWYIEQFGRTPDEGKEAKKEELATALSSMMYGGFEDRRRYEAALTAITDPYECKACGWKVYGLFGDMGKGVFVYIKSELKGCNMFMPISWVEEKA